MLKIGQNLPQLRAIKYRVFFMKRGVYRQYQPFYRLPLISRLNSRRAVD